MIEDWDNRPAVQLEIWKDGDYMMSASVYHYLVAMLSIDDETEQWEKEFYAYAESNDGYWLSNMEDWAKSKGWDVGIHNTYNGDCALSQTLQYAYCYENDLILLQIHNGADVRGGYTKPRVFKADEGFVFYNDFDAYCDKCEQGWYTDDMGYHWYPSNSGQTEEFGISRDDCEELTCDHALHENCGGKLSISNRSEH
jgi:hypothetical protein